MLSEAEVLRVLHESGAYLTGHFKLTSGRHSGEYIEKFRVLQEPKHASRLCSDLASRFAGDRVSVVLGPAVGGIIIAYEVARALGTRAIFAEREEGRLALRRGFELHEGERVLVVEDVVTTGGSVREVLDLVAHCGAVVVGVGVLADRSQGACDFGVRTEALVHLDVKSYDPSDCPLCRAGVPITERGSRNLR